ncbi:MAG: hypothetical protein IKO22_02185 [Oscillospiraceae bacterium]|nr:hypothetical protein [Oscillospiraceae bacterium]
MRKRGALAALLAALLLLLLAPMALADDSTTLTAVRNEYIRVLIDMPNGSTMRSHRVESGEMAPGLSLRAEGEGLGVYGTPDTLGNWSVTVRCTTDDGELLLTIHQYIIASSAPAAVGIAPTAAPAEAAGSTAEPEQEMTAEPQPTPPPAATPVPTLAPTPEPTLAPTPEGRPVIRKEPSGETVTRGGTAIFVARADGAAEIVWYLLDNSGEAEMPAQQATEFFSGLRIYGQGTETLTVSGIPSGLNGWRAECRFIGPTGTVAVSDDAVITVREKGISSPGLIFDPQKVELYTGESVTLSVSALPPEGAAVRYQWYSTDKYDLASVKAIEGATDTSFTPPFIPGTLYYCVGVRSVRTSNGEESSTAYSDLAEIRCIEGERTHEHVFSSYWLADGVSHWHGCDCGQRQDEGEHEIDWTVIRRATSRRDGERRGVCRVCGYEAREAISAGAAERTDTARIVLAVLAGLVILLILMGIILLSRRSRRRRRSRRPRSRTYHSTHTPRR